MPYPHPTLPLPSSQNQPPPPLTPTLPLPRLPLPRRPLHRHPLRHPAPTRRPAQNAGAAIPLDLPPPHPTRDQPGPQHAAKALARHPALRHPHGARLSPVLLLAERPAATRRTDPRAALGGGGGGGWWPGGAGILFVVGAAAVVERGECGDGRDGTGGGGPGLDAGDGDQGAVRIESLCLPIDPGRGDGDTADGRREGLLLGVRGYGDPGCAVCGALCAVLRAGEAQAECALCGWRIVAAGGDGGGDGGADQFCFGRVGGGAGDGVDESVRCGQDEVAAYAG